MNSYLTIHGNALNESISNETELQVLRGVDLVERARLDLVEARFNAHAFTSSHLPSSLKHYLLWGAVGLTTTTGAVSTTVGGMATIALVGGGVIDGVNHFVGNAQADHPDTLEWAAPVGGVVVGAVTALLARGAWNTGLWMIDLIGRENAEQLKALRQKVEAAETRLANAVAELSASEWQSFVGGLGEGQLAPIVQSFRLLREDRLIQAMEKIVDSGLIHQIGLVSLSPEDRAKLRVAYARYGDYLVELMSANDLQRKMDACGRHVSHLLACMSLSPTGFSTDLSDSLRAELQRPERQDQVHVSVHMSPGLAEMMDIHRDHVLRFGQGVGGVGKGLMEIARDVPWVSQWRA